MQSRFAALLLLSMIGPASAHAQAPTYAVLSLVGDRLLVVSREGSAGSNLIDPHTKRFIPVGNTELDRTVLAAVRDIAAGSKATHLVLVTKQRHEAMLPVSNGRVGSGWLEGLGFYIDCEQGMRNNVTGEGFTGFLAPFAYFRVSLIELATGKVLGEEAVYASLTTGRRSVSHPWDALTPKQKVQVIEGMLRAEVARVIPIVLGR